MAEAAVDSAVSDGAALAEVDKENANAAATAGKRISRIIRTPSVGIVGELP